MYFSGIHICRNIHTFTCITDDNVSLIRKFRADKVQKDVGTNHRRHNQNDGRVYTGGPLIFRLFGHVSIYTQIECIAFVYSRFYIFGEQLAGV